MSDNRALAGEYRTRRSVVKRSGMSRRADPARISFAQRSGVAARIADTGIPRAEVERWLDAWAAQDRQGGWDAAYGWVLGEVAAKRKPPTRDV
jgi:hypothetical protein